MSQEIIQIAKLLVFACVLVFVLRVPLSLFRLIRYKMRVHQCRQSTVGKIVKVRYSTDSIRYIDYIVEYKIDRVAYHYRMRDYSANSKLRQGSPVQLHYDLRKPTRCINSLREYCSFGTTVWQSLKELLSVVAVLIVLVYAYRLYTTPHSDLVNEAWWQRIQSLLREWK